MVYKVHDVDQQQSTLPSQNIFLPTDVPERLDRRRKETIDKSYKTACVPRESVLNEAEAIEAWMKALENDGQSENGDEEKEIPHNLELMERHHLQVEQKDLADYKLVKVSEAGLMIAKEVAKRNITAREEAINE